MIHNIIHIIQHTARAATVLLLALLTAQTAGATETSTITVGGTDYTLFTGFTATGGSEGVGGAFTYDKVVDGNMSSSWHDQSSGIYVEFNTDDPIIPKGYIFNTYMEGYFYPQAWVLKAKANATDGWTTLSSYSGQTLSSGQEFQYACSNDGNTAYKYFRFEASNSNNNIWLTEIRLYGYENLTYTHLTVRDATCTEVGIKVDCYQRSDGKYFTDETGATELAESDVVIPMIAHTGIHHSADANHIEYWQCSMCNKYFSNEACTTEITEAQTLAVKYLDGNGTLTTLDADATTMTSTTTSWTGGWYMLYDDVTIADRISVSGTVNLILANGATLTASKGITVGSSATLNLYAQSDDEATMGALVATAENNSNNAAIGGVNNTNFGTIVINGGKITATTNSNSGAGIGGGYGSTGGSITINGGIVSATAGGYSNSAGIGGGNNGYVASVTLNGGIITATGDTQYGGAGIGTGAYASSGTMTITIGSGVKKLVATRGSGSDCIGKGTSASTTVNVVFKNGETTVEGDDKDAVFYDTGEGTVRQVRAKALNHAVTMSNDLKANITAMPEYALAGETVTLTLGAAVDASTLKVNDGTSDLTLTDAGNSQYTFTMPDGDVTVTATAAQSYAVNLPANMEVVSATNAADANGKYITGTIVTFKPEFGYEASNVSDGTNALTATDGVYSVTVADADITITATVERSSTINLADAPGDFMAIAGDLLTGTTSHTVTITDGASITLSGATITGGIVCDGSATITLVGTNSVSGWDSYDSNIGANHYSAGIQIGGSGTTLTINGDGSLTATGGYEAAGIGLNRAWNVTEDVVGGNIVINGGTITANGGTGGAGIGAGVTKDTQNSSSRKAIIGNITITGGTVTAVGGSNADGIGAGQNNYNATIQIGTVTIYDGIDKVDASSIKDFASVVYMHDETNVTANKTDYFAIGEDGNRKLIVQKPVIAEIPDQTYTGSEITPEPTVTIGSLTLTKSTDYTYSYTNNTNVGTATVTVTFQGDYESLGSVEKEFNIVWSETDTDEYTIHNAAEWNVFCDCLNDNDTYNRFSGKTVRLDADITVTRMAGSSGHEFTGTFDGDGHTLTLDYGTADAPIDAQFVAPFVETAADGDHQPTFRNLTIAGSIYEGYTGSEAHNVGGLIGHLFGTVTIEHCTSNVSINATSGAGGFVGLCEHSVSFNDCHSAAVITSPGGNNGGFVAWSRSSAWEIKFTGCLFDGKLLQQNGNGASNGGFIGWKGDAKTVNITNSLCAPAPLATGETMATGGSATFSREHSDYAATITNCYYTAAFDIAQGHATHTVTAGTDVTVAHAGVATHYATSGITAYKATGASADSDPFIAGLLYNNILYAGSGDQLGLTLTTSAVCPQPGYQYGYTASAGTLSGTTLTMPDQDVTVNVDTETLRSTRQAVTVAYMTADGSTQTAQAVALDGHETVDEDGDVCLAGTYYVGTDIAYANQIYLNGDVTLILADGKTMTLNGNTPGIINDSRNLTIYGQSLDADAGTLRYNGTADGITVNNYEQHSGNVSITTTGSTIDSWVWGIDANDVTLLGGTLTVTASSTNAIAIMGGTHSILGGQLTANATGTDATGIYASASSGTAITLGWTRPADRITVSSISAGGGTVAVATGQALTDGSGHIYTGTLTASELSGFAAETTLQPCLALADAASNTAAITDHAGQTLAVALSGRTLYKDGSWNTLCLPFAVTTASGTLSGDGVKAMTLDTETSNLTDGTLTLNFDDATGQTIPAGTPFIIKWDGDGTANIENPVFEDVTIEAEKHDATIEGVLTFTGTYAPVSIGSEGDNTKLYLGSSNTLYYPNGEMTIGCHRAYFQLKQGLSVGDPSSSAHAIVLNFGGGTTSVQNVQSSMFNVQSDDWYTLDGRKLNGKPTQRGIYIHKGNKIVINRL